MHGWQRVMICNFMSDQSGNAYLNNFGLFVIKRLEFHGKKHLIIMIYGFNTTVIIIFFYTPCILHIPMKGCFRRFFKEMSWVS